MEVTDVNLHKIIHIVLVICCKLLCKNCRIKLQHNGNLNILLISQVLKLSGKWSYWFKIFFGGTSCEVRYWGLILRVTEQKNTHRELQADTFKCSSGATKPNPPQRMDKSAQSCGQVPNCGNHLKHLAALVGTPAPSPYSNRASHRCVCRCHLTWHSHSSEHTQRVALPVPQAQTAGLASWASPCTGSPLQTNVASFITLLHENPTICTS